VALFRLHLGPERGWVWWEAPVWEPGSAWVPDSEFYRPSATQSHVINVLRSRVIYREWLDKIVFNGLLYRPARNRDSTPRKAPIGFGRRKGGRGQLKLLAVKE
jgi:hypothetical protein